MSEERIVTNVHNCMEDAVSDMLDDILKHQPHVCGCERCRSDILAIALNNLKPRYVSTKTGEVFIKVEQSDNQNRSNIITALTNAIQIVTKNKRH